MANFRYIQNRFKINIHKSTAGMDVLDKESKKWEDLVESLNSRAPTGMKFIMVSAAFTQMKVEKEVLGSTMLSFITSVGTCLMSVLVFTGNIPLSLLTTLTTLLISITLSGFVSWLLAWEFGAIQAIGLTTFMGMSIDYVLHLAHGYNTAHGDNRREKVEEALVHMGSALLGGAMT